MRYSSGFKASAVRKVIEGTGRSITEVAKETGIYPATLGDWIRRYKDGRLGLEEGDSISPGDRNPGEKLTLLLESKTLAPEKMGEWLRSRGLHSEHLTLWEQELVDTMQDKDIRAKAENAALRKENKALKKELARKEKALAEAAILITLKKKYPNLFEQEEAD
jgi:transposase